jgi:hypothetical protein
MKRLSALVFVVFALLYRDSAFAMRDQPPSSGSPANPKIMSMVPVGRLPETSLSNIDPEIIFLTEQRVMQRLVPLLQRELDSVCEENERSKSALRRAVDELSGRLTRDENAIRELTAQQQQEMAQRKVDMVHTAFAIGAANPKLMPHHINDTATSISRKATIEERHVAVSAVYEQLKLLNNILPQDKLRIIGDYVTNTAVEEKKYLKDHEGFVPPYWPWQPNESSFESVQQSFVEDVISPIRRGIVSGRGYGTPSGYYLNADAVKKWNAIAADLNRRPNLRINAQNAEYAHRYEADVARAEGIPFPAIELDDLITQFNGLLTLHTHQGAVL